MKHVYFRHVGGGGTISRSNNNGGTISSARTRTPSPSPVAGGEDQEAQGSSCTVSTQVPNQRQHITDMTFRRTIVNYLQG